MVLSKDPQTGDIDFKAITDIIPAHDRVIWEVSLTSDSGEVESFETTDDHPWWIPQGGWVETENLTTGMTATTADGRDITISSVVETTRTDATYNITVADFETYFVGKNKVLVHNCNLRTKDTDFGVMTDGSTSEIKSAVGEARLDKALGNPAKANCAKCKLTESIKSRKADQADSLSRGQSKSSARFKKHEKRIKLETKELKSLD